MQTPATCALYRNVDKCQSRYKPTQFYRFQKPKETRHGLGSMSQSNKASGSKETFSSSLPKTEKAGRRYKIRPSSEVSTQDLKSLQISEKHSHIKEAHHSENPHPQVIEENTKDRWKCYTWF